MNQVYESELASMQQRIDDLERWQHAAIEMLAERDASIRELETKVEDLKYQWETHRCDD